MPAENATSRTIPPQLDGSGEVLLRNISAMALVDETAMVNTLLKAVQPFERKQVAIQARAQDLVLTMRKAGSGSGVEAFLYEYGLNNKEGVAVMCLAEALLRIPDNQTADKLIADKFRGADWDKHLGHSESLFVNASSWGLMLTGKVVNLGRVQDEPSSVLKGLINKCGEPVIREALKRAMHIIGTQFVMGEDIKDAKSNGAKQEKRGYSMSYDILGEGARNQQQADAYYSDYLNAIEILGKDAKPEPDIHQTRGISIKLSGLHPRYNLLKEQRLMDELLPRVKELVRKARDNHLTISVDAEEANRLDINLKIYTAIFNDSEFDGYEGLGYVLQAYQKRAFYVLDYLAALSRNKGKKMPLRLVKGAYWDTEIKYAQMMGLEGYPVFTRKEHTDVSYLACVNKIFDLYEAFSPQFATHNAHTVASIIEIADGRKFEFQRLHGMGEKLYSQLVKTLPVRIYAPVGKHVDLLAYLIRRLLENGANTSFVNMLMNKTKAVEEIIEDPIALTQKHHAAPSAKIPLPARLYGRDRQNSYGFELGYLAQKETLEAVIQQYATTQWNAAPIVTADFKDGSRHNIMSPAQLSQKVGEVVHGDAALVSKAMESAQEAFVPWSETSIERRAQILEAIADALEANRDEFYALCQREAGKNLPDAIAEVREAVDFCRYYAARASELMGNVKLFAGPTGERNTMKLSGRGVFVCISPWNFPLAIFTGQIVAALVTGNCAVAKPADQTPLIAAFATRLMHKAGIPKAVLQLIPGTGLEVGEAMVKHKLTAGVVFTGSTATARNININLAKKKGPIVPLIAETGGQNCMIIDSSALLEQAADDVIMSAFGSAGQRCSALRVLYVQDAIADKFLALLAGTMREYAVGNPQDLSNDFGPVIDIAALNKLKEHIAYLEGKDARLVATQPVGDKGHYFAPHAYEIPSVNLLYQEIFGPILHIVRWKDKNLDAVIDEINATDFGLTFGVQSRIEATIDYITSRIHAGNIYVNRSMTGATVGVQPFGGEGLSGTGPKAGGPNYLLRFVHERTVTVNTAAIGGNLELLL
ncbi:MAG: bifunctional proline dehydrogenase/L-glutamate gamma-semialdehyde dehydrogenase PutA [Alphaproteobacteria bacterium]|nr:bifunctional proline dehydrogenase/L-glutamate gamma-semialdehyde dehydrogenase PutA [Alphaproteobacteria bacterium]